HHENEIAQAKCGHPDEDFARIWMHNEWVTLDGAKMAKSGRSFKVRDVLKDADPEVVRLFLLSAHYRKPVDFTFDKLEELSKAKGRVIEAFNGLAGFLKWRAEERSENWLRTWSHWNDLHNFNHDEFQKRMSRGGPDAKVDLGDTFSERLVDAARRNLYFAHEVLADDFNTQGAIGFLMLLANRIGAYLPSMTIESDEDFTAANIALGALVHLTEILGILKTERESLYLVLEERVELAKGKGNEAALEG
ncbi:unnamed protein product, partial [marine sediment metagenome]